MSRFDADVTEVIVLSWLMLGPVAIVGALAFGAIWWFVGLLVAYVMTLIAIGGTDD